MTTGWEFDQRGTTLNTGKPIVPVAVASTEPATPPAHSAAEVVWMLDMDEDDWPVLAHQIVGVEHEGQRDEVRLTACGRRVTAEMHPRGWWSFPPGRFPLAANAVHCHESETAVEVGP